MSAGRPRSTSWGSTVVSMAQRESSEVHHARFRLPLAGRGGHGALEIVIGDLTKDTSDAVVIPRADVLGGSMVDLATHRVAGPALLRALRESAPSSGPVVTPAFSLPARYVIHVEPTRYVENPARAAQRLRACYRDSLALAQRRGFASIAFPSVATGGLGYPVAEASRVAIEAVVAQVGLGTDPLFVRFVLYGPSTFDVYAAAALDRLGAPASPDIGRRASGTF